MLGDPFLPSGRFTGVLKALIGFLLVFLVSVWR
jgi:hypothetical protein